jgi:heterodisulfide reductase subunit A
MEGSVMVIGAGPAGMRASSELLQQGFRVYLLEEKPTIGGKMAQIDKMFPTNECATCTALPRMLELTSNPNLTLLAFVDVISIDGSPGDFKVKLLKKPRYVDPVKCTACTDCFPVCPVGGVPMEFNLGRGGSKAISFYSPFPPRKALINPRYCNYILKGKCGDKEKPPCVEACKPEAINFSQKPQEVTINVGAVILATGADEIRDDALLGIYGYGKIQNVLTALEYERLLSGLGPTSGVVKLSDGSEPQTIAWLVLDGSSSIGFMTAAAEALGTIEKNSEALATVFYKDMNLGRDSYNNFYSNSKECGVRFIRSDFLSVEAGDGGAILVSYSVNGEKANLTAEMLVLVPPLAAPTGARKLLDMLDIKTNESGFARITDSVSHPVRTGRPGVFICGAAGGLKGIDDSIVEACSASANAASLLASSKDRERMPTPKTAPLPVKAEDEPEIAVVICRCGLNIAGLVDLDEVVSYTASLSHVKQVELTPFGCDGVSIKKLLGTGEYNRVVVGACSPKTHETLFEQHLEFGGLNRQLLEIVNLRNHCTWVHSNDKKGATAKARTLIKMGVSRSALLEPLTDIEIPVTQSCLVIGCTPSGIAGALTLAKMGFEVHVVESEPEPSKMPENQEAAVKELLEELIKHEKVKIHAGAKIEAIDGFVGNYRVETEGKERKEEIDVGAVMIATEREMGVSSNGAGYEAALALARNEKGRFVPRLGILNIQDFNTEGVFMCGPAREDVGPIESIVEGEAASSRIAGILSNKEMVKSPRISVVVDANCDGCAYCVDPCPAHAITLVEYMHEGAVKKTVEVNAAICRGCGICMATCPKEGIYVRHFRPEQFKVMIESLQEVS